MVAESDGATSESPRRLNCATKGSEPETRAADASPLTPHAPRLPTVAALARAMGVTPAAVFQWRRMGCPALASAPPYCVESVRRWRAERCGGRARGTPQERARAAAVREFTQFGLEILNPREPVLAIEQLTGFVRDWAVGEQLDFRDGATRGLGYYSGLGFEVHKPSLGSASQVCGGGPYPEGVGCAWGVDRLAMEDGDG